MINPVKIVVDTTGAAGAATGSAQTPVRLTGKVYAVHLDYSSAAPATTDVNLRMANAPNENILSYANASTDVWLYPRKVVHDASGQALNYQSTQTSSIVGDPYVVADQLLLSVAGCDALTPAVTATVYLIS